MIDLVIYDTVKYLFNCNMKMLILKSRWPIVIIVHLSTKVMHWHTLRPPYWQVRFYWLDLVGTFSDFSIYCFSITFVLPLQVCEFSCLHRTAQVCHLRIGGKLSKSAYQPNSYINFIPSANSFGDGIMESPCPSALHISCKCNIS